jgi:hypothetical protein
MLCPAIMARVACFLPEKLGIGKTRNLELGRPGGSVQLQCAVKIVLTTAARTYCTGLLGLNEAERRQCRHLQAGSHSVEG